MGRKQPLEQLLPGWAATAAEHDVRLHAFPVAEVVFDERTVLKCRYHCPAWGRRWTCGPDTWGPREMIPLLQLYRSVVVATGLDVGRVTSEALAVERAAFNHGYPFALAVAVTMCSLCTHCTYPETDCQRSHDLRPESPMAGIDTLETLRRQGISPDGGEGWLRASFVFVE